MILLCAFLLSASTTASAATLSGKAIDIGKRGAPIKGVKVIVEKHGKPLPQMAGKSPVFTDTLGRYTIANLPPGEIQVRFDKLNFNPRTPQKVEMKGNSVSLDAEMWRADGDLDYQKRVALFKAAREHIDATEFMETNVSLAHVLGDLSDATKGKGAYPGIQRFTEAGVSRETLEKLLTNKSLWNVDGFTMQSTLPREYGLHLNLNSKRTNIGSGPIVVKK